MLTNLVTRPDTLRRTVRALNITIPRWVALADYIDEIQCTTKMPENLDQLEAAFASVTQFNEVELLERAIGLGGDIVKVFRRSRAIGHKLSLKLCDHLDKVCIDFELAKFIVVTPAVEPDLPRALPGYRCSVANTLYTWRDLHRVEHFCATNTPFERTLTHYLNVEKIYAKWATPRTYVKIKCNCGVSINDMLSTAIYIALHGLEQFDRNFPRTGHVCACSR